MANSKQIKNIRVSDVISNSEIEKWENGSIITISAGTGKGKSYFIKNILLSYARQENKKILMLIHRSNCVEQFRQEIRRDGKEKYIDIMTYQAIESREINHCGVDMSKYKYICCDEFHYFLSDASFNKTTDISFDNIMNQNNAIRIFMSATGGDIKRYMERIKKLKIINYEIPLDFSFIESLTFFNKDSTLENFIEELIEKDHKAIFFIQSAEKAYKLYKKYESYSLFNCGKNNPNYYKYVNENKINQMLIDEKFSELILITTSCMDAGVNIIDERVQHIVVDIKDIGSLIQCIGRKRIQKDEQIHVYIKTINNQQLGGLETRTKKDIEMADYLRKHTVKEYMDKYPRSYDKLNIVYDESAIVNGVKDDNSCIKKINELMYFKKKIDIAEYQMMRIKWGEFGYCKQLAHLFGFYNKEHNSFNYRTINEDNTLVTYLNKMVGEVMLQCKDRSELIEKINLRGDGKLRCSREALNIELETRELNYVIREFKTSRVIDGKKKNFKSAWVVEKIQDDDHYHPKRA